MADGARGLGQVLDALDGRRHVLLAGAGGGHDVFAGIPLWWHLRDAGVEVSWASLSFTDAIAMGDPVAPDLSCYAVGPTPSTIGESFAAFGFAELHLARWLAGQGVASPVVWTMPSNGLVPFRAAYRWLADRLRFDALVLIDGGNDSLMGGWEHGLGSVAEDVVSILAGASLDDVPCKLLVCAGLGTDARHGVGLADTLEAIAELTRLGGWVGACALTTGDPGVDAFCSAVAAANEGQSARWTVANAIAAAAAGRFGPLETGTAGNGDASVWVNPMMAMYWAFDLAAVVQRLAYAPVVEGTHSIRDVMQAVMAYRRANGSRPAKFVPY